MKITDKESILLGNYGDRIGLGIQSKPIQYFNSCMILGVDLTGVEMWIRELSKISPSLLIEKTTICKYYS